MGEDYSPVGAVRSYLSSRTLGLPPRPERCAATKGASRFPKRDLETEPRGAPPQPEPVPSEPEDECSTTGPCCKSPGRKNLLKSGGVPAKQTSSTIQRSSVGR